MTPTPLNQADVIASQAALIAADKAVLEKAIAAREILSTEGRTLKAQEEVLSSTVDRDDDAAVRALTEVRVKRELAERDLSKLEREIADVVKRLPRAVFSLCALVERFHAASDERLSAQVRAAEAKARAPYDPASDRLRRLGLCLADSRYISEGEGDILRNADRLLIGWRAFVESEKAR